MYGRQLTNCSLSSGHLSGPQRPPDRKWSCSQIRRLSSVSGRSCRWTRSLRCSGAHKSFGASAARAAMPVELTVFQLDGLTCSTTTTPRTSTRSRKSGCSTSQPGLLDLVAAVVAHAKVDHAVVAGARSRRSLRPLPAAPLRAAPRAPRTRAALAARWRLGLEPPPFCSDAPSQPNPSCAPSSPLLPSTERDESLGLASPPSFGNPHLNTAHEPRCHRQPSRRHLLSMIIADGATIEGDRGGFPWPGGGA